jgi:hypothetical protein
MRWRGLPTGTCSQWDYVEFNQQFLIFHRMKKFRFLLLFLSSMALLPGCDKINPPYMVVENPPIDTTECPIPDFPVKTTHFKTVLIEEYTGHTCVNCPTAAKTAHDIISTYGDSVVLMAIHAGFFAVPEPGDYSLDLNSTAGTELHANFGITSNPAATFNRKYIGGARIFEAASAWEATFLQAQDTLPLVDMQMIVNYNASLNRACIHVETEYLADINRNLMLAIYVTEDSIIGFQKNNNTAVGTTPDISNYVFMHVLRGAVNGVWGTTLSNTAIATGTKTISSFKLIPNALWVGKNCHLVAIVYDADTEEILQVVSEKMIP